jgi:hypothetical protein
MHRAALSPLVLVVAMAALPHGIEAQQVGLGSIAGTVTAAETGAPLPRATVSVLGTPLAAQTDGIHMPNLPQHFGPESVERIRCGDEATFEALFRTFADSLGLSIKTVEAQMGRALKALRSKLLSLRS